MAKSSQLFTVFYCWQSDTLGGHCRHLIRRALDQAADVINADEAVPFKIHIDQDTQNVTGLCDIPAVILDKIAKADAVVVDLTFVAKTTPRAEHKPKYCSNPNALFELGYAFHSVGFERLVCVMNEAHGPRTEQMFDIIHRRHPITFESARGADRGKVLRGLTKELVDAIRPIVLKGPRSVASDHTDNHDIDRATIQTFRDEVFPKRTNSALMTIRVFPQTYLDRIWPDGESVRCMMHERGTMNGGYKFPNQHVETATMEWGIYNGAYGEQWSTTYAGQFWYQDEISARWEGPVITERTSRITNLPEGTKFGEDNFIDLGATLEKICNVFDFIRSYSLEFHDSQLLLFDVQGANLRGKFLLPESRWADYPMGPCLSQRFSRRFEISAADFRQTWKSICFQTAQELCGLFSRNGLRLSDQVLRDRLGSYTPE